MSVVELRPNGDPVSRWLTKRQAAAYANVSERTLDRARRAGELRASGGHGYKVLFLPEEVDAWMENRGSGD